MTAPPARRNGASDPKPRSPVQRPLDCGETQMVPRQARSLGRASAGITSRGAGFASHAKPPGGPPMIRLTAFVAAVLFAAPAVAITPVIDELTPNHYQAKSGEHFLTI